MPDKTKCPRCDRTGFVRVEHVIKAGHSQRHYYCGACDYTWAVVEDPPASNDQTGDS